MQNPDQKLKSLTTSIRSHYSPIADLEAYLQAVPGAEDTNKTNDDITSLKDVARFYEMVHVLSNRAHQFTNSSWEMIQAELLKLLNIYTHVLTHLGFSEYINRHLLIEWARNIHANSGHCSQSSLEASNLFYTHLEDLYYLLSTSVSLSPPEPACDEESAVSRCTTPVSDATFLTALSTAQDGQWSHDEECRLYGSLRRYIGSHLKNTNIDWAQVSETFGPSRTLNALRNKWEKIRRNKAKLHSIRKSLQKLSS